MHQQIMWPSNRPDMNDIETVWGTITHKLGSDLLQAVATLRNIVRQHWNEITVEDLRRLYMPPFLDEMRYCRGHVAI